MRRALAVAVVATLALSGCAGEAGEPSTTPNVAESPTQSPTQSPTEGSTESPSEAPAAAEADVQITISGNSVEPNGQRLKVSVGEPLVLEISSDRAAELHVHATPEQEIEVKRGTSTVDLTIDSPGIVEVEEHESGIVVLQLEVR